MFQALSSGKGRIPSRDAPSPSCTVHLGTDAELALSLPLAKRAATMAALSRIGRMGRRLPTAAATPQQGFDLFGTPLPSLWRYALPPGLRTTSTFGGCAKDRRHESHWCSTDLDEIAVRLQCGKRCRRDGSSGRKVLPQFQRVESPRHRIVGEWKQRHVPVLDVSRQLVVASGAGQYHVGQGSQRRHVGPDWPDQEEAPFRQGFSRMNEQRDIEPFREHTVKAGDRRVVRQVVRACRTNGAELIEIDTMRQDDDFLRRKLGGNDGTCGQMRSAFCASSASSRSIRAWSTPGIAPQSSPQ